MQWLHITIGSLRQTVNPAGKRYARMSDLRASAPQATYPKSTARDRTRRGVALMPHACCSLRGSLIGQSFEDGLQLSVAAKQDRGDPEFFAQVQELLDKPVY